MSGIGVHDVKLPKNQYRRPASAGCFLSFPRRHVLGLSPETRRKGLSTEASLLTVLGLSSSVPSQSPMYEGGESKRLEGLLTLAQVITLSPKGIEWWSMSRMFSFSDVRVGIVSRNHRRLLPPNRPLCSIARGSGAGNLGHMACCLVSVWKTVKQFFFPLIWLVISSRSLSLRL